MFKKNLPFAVFLGTLIALVALMDGGFVLLEKQDIRNADRLLSMLSQGNVDEANRALLAIHSFYKREPGSWELPAYLKSLATSLGETEITIQDSVDLRKYVERIESWPQPLKAHAKVELWREFLRPLPLKEKIGALNRFREFMDWVQADKTAMKSLYAQSRFFKLASGLEPLLIGTTLIITSVQFLLIGPILLLFLLWEWLLERKHRVVGESFAMFTLSPAQVYLVLGIYFLTLVLTYLPAIPVLHGKPFMLATTAYFIYLLSLPACIALIMPLTILAILKHDIQRMRKGNDIADRPRDGIVLLSWVKQYKFFLWRLWPVWLVNGLAAGLLMKLYWGYQFDIYGLYGMVRPW